MPDSVTTWGQLAFFAVASACGIVWAVSQLFKTMGSTYGGIVAAQQQQITLQATQIVALHEQIAKSERDCSARMSQMEADFTARLDRLRSEYHSSTVVENRQAIAKLAEDAAVAKTVASIAATKADQTDAKALELGIKVDSLTDSVTKNVERRKQA